MKQTVQRTQLVVLLAGLVFPVLLALLGHQFFGSRLWPNVPLHALLEGAGVVLNFSLGIYLVSLVRAELLEKRFLWPASGFLAMAVISGFHGSVVPGNTFVGLHSVGVLTGGVLFSLMVLPSALHDQAWLKHLPWLGLLLGLLVSVSLLLADQLYPTMLVFQSQFSRAAMAMNSLGALGFFLATLYLVGSRRRALSYQILAVVTLLFSISAILFEYSELWDSTWWLWHFLRFFALSLLLSYFFFWFYRQAEKARVQTKKLRSLAYYDNLTQLPNRTLFLQFLDNALVDARRQQHSLALFFIDLDRFKHVNDTLGHDVGDRLLVMVAERLANSLRQVDLVARMGGDEFTVILHGDQNPAAVETVAKHILQAVLPPYHLDEHTVEIGASIGIAFYPDDAQAFTDLMRLADQAMYRAKEAGGNTFCFYHHEGDAAQAQTEAP
ncbi:GGDEF domain-containing protein [Hydrogenovibrio halophilus]|uniref:GGDEF domain-containing protein n=1 Tax=Hydrogenovibrio halophilus TaxID=373391 RepID=UPI001FDF3170|nr:GGDEF domain-containing protein [Hydrogenovibrio halophilus]